jgi:hypothetical protein
MIRVSRGTIHRSYSPRCSIINDETRIGNCETFIENIKLERIIKTVYLNSPSKK